MHGIFTPRVVIIDLNSTLSQPLHTRWFGRVDKTEVCPVMHHLPSPWCYCGHCTCVCLLGAHIRRLGDLTRYSDCATASLCSSPAPCSTDFSLMNMQMQIMTSEPACGPKQAPTCSRSRAFMCLRWFVCVRARIHAQAHIPAQARNRTDTSLVHQ